MPPLAMRAAGSDGPTLRLAYSSINHLADSNCANHCSRQCDIFSCSLATLQLLQSWVCIHAAGRPKRSNLTGPTSIEVRGQLSSPWVEADVDREHVSPTDLLGMVYKQMHSTSGVVLQPHISSQLLSISISTSHTKAWPTSSMLPLQLRWASPVLLSTRAKR